MGVNDLYGALLAKPESRPRLWRYWLAPLMMASDWAVVAALVYLASTAYALTMYGVLVPDRVTPELAGMLATLFTFTNLLRGRYQIGNYLSARGQIASAFTVWNITMVAFLVLLFLAKIADNYSRSVILATYLVGSRSFPCLDA